MANTKRQSRNVYTIIPDGATDWDLETDVPLSADVGWKVKTIMIKPSATDDIVVIKSGTTTDGTATAATILSAKFESVYDTRVFNFGEGVYMWPMIDDTDCTYGTAANVRITFILA